MAMTAAAVPARVAAMVSDGAIAVAMITVPVITPSIMATAAKIDAERTNPEILGGHRLDIEKRHDCQQGQANQK